MALKNVRSVFVVQDRDTGAFVDINMSFVKMLRHAARADSREIANESMGVALYDGILECSEGYEVIELFELCE